MACDTIMMRDPESIRPETMVPEAAKLMLDHGIRALPVTDDNGTYVGRFTTVHLIELLLPKAATIPGGLTDLTFVHDELEDLRERLDDVRNHKVGDYMETDDLVVVKPSTSIMEAMLLLYQHRTHVPVVDPETHKLVGVVSFSCVLNAITGEN